MNPFLLPPDERMAHWKDFRKSLMINTDVTGALKAVAEYWAKAPLVLIAYDTNDALNWPSPWEMIQANEWCRSSVAIGMESTLRLAGLPADRMKLKLILDRDIQELLLVLIVDEAWVLNYDWGFVQPCPTTDHRILKEWQYVGRSYSLLDG